MTTQPTKFTFHDLAQELKIPFLKKCQIGTIIAETYKQIFHEKPKKVKRNGMLVNEYDSEFLVIVDNILRTEGIIK